MVKNNLKRPEMKINAFPLKDEDKYDFLPYIDRKAGVLPSEQDNWKTDEKACQFIKALKSGQDLTDTDWTDMNLKGADLSGYDLSGINLSKSNCMGTNFSGCNLTWTNFSYAFLEDTNFSNAKMKNVQMKGVFYRNCYLDGAEIDKDTLSYLESLEWFVEQIENGKIRLDEIPLNQLNYLDLRMIDMRQVKLPDGIDLSGLVLTGVNLSGVYIPKGHFLNMAMMAQQERRIKLIAQKSKKTLSLLLKKIQEERKEKIKKLSEAEFEREKEIPKYASQLKRPSPKINTSDTDVKKSDETVEDKRTQETKGNVSTIHLSSQNRKFKMPKINFKKRA